MTEWLNESHWMNEWIKWMNENEWKRMKMNDWMKINENRWKWMKMKEWMKMMNENELI